ncbi:hypothetical protein ACIBK1_18570 [Microbispora rosea]|uniref:hypothetical protein n=1 Tax=Microbispora rosea TaxID=58117 RepID=UPI0037B42F84
MRHSVRRNPHLVLRLIERETSPVARPGPLVVLWRWRYEATLLVGGPAVVGVAVRAAGPAVTIVAGSLVGLLVLLWPQARREVAGRFWCVVTPHRVRKACAEALIVSRRGKLPVILRTRPEPFGERLWVWCRAGTSPGDLERARDMIAAACWLAHEVRIARDPHRTSVVIVDVLRRAGRPVPGEPAETGERTLTRFRP